MEWVNGISADDRTLMRRLTIALAAIFIFTFAYTRLDVLYSHKFFDVTGEAEWIWARHPMSRGIPIAFFVTRNFDLPEDRYYTKIKVAADPEYTLYFNGQMIAGRRGEDGNVLDVYDVSKLARTGTNRIVIAARSANGVGGVIAAVDTHPDFHILRTDAQWNVVRQWSDDLPFRDPPTHRLTPMLLGRPPAGRWNYLTSREGEFLKPPARVVMPVQAIRLTAGLPDISVIGGVAVAGSHPTPGVAYDFGNIDARVQLIASPTVLSSRRVRIRRGYSLGDLTPPEGLIEAFVLAPGEKMLTDPQTHNFRYVLVYGDEASARAVQ